MKLAHPCLALALLTLAAPVAAQYKVVDANGSVTYTDRPPTGGNVKVTEVRRGAPAAADSGLGALPADLRQVVQRYPVVLYTANECAPCVTGRALLTQRGIPFTERKLVTEDDLTTMERALGWRTVPSLTIGSQPLRGFSSDEWPAFLDAAGYPRESRLPRGWTPPGALPATQTAPAQGASAPLPANGPQPPR